MRFVFVFALLASFAFADSDHSVPDDVKRPVMVGPSRQFTKIPDIVSISLGGPSVYSSCSATVMGSANPKQPPKFLLTATHCVGDSTTGFFTTPGSEKQFPVKCFPNPQYSSAGQSVDVMLCAIGENARSSVATEMKGARSCFAPADLEATTGKELTFCGYGFPHHVQACMEHTLSDLRHSEAGGSTYLFSNTFKVHETRSGDSGGSFHKIGKNGVKLVYASLAGAEGSRNERDTAPSVSSQAARSYFNSVLRQFPGTSICRGEESSEGESPSAPPSPSSTSRAKFVASGTEPDSIAESLEVQPGDQIISLNGRRPKTLDEFKKRIVAVLRRPVGTEIFLKVLRNGKQIVLRTDLTDDARESCLEDREECRLGMRLRSQ